MIAYVDTSVLIAAFTIDALSARARHWLAGAPSLRISSWGAAEFSAAVLRKHRLGELDKAGLEAAEQILDRLISNPAAFDAATKDDVLEARRLVRLCPPLRAPDALHLAIARRMALPMATFDNALRKAAATVGVATVSL